MATDEFLNEDELITRRAVRAVRRAGPIALAFAVAAGLATYLLQDVGESTYVSEAVVELTDETAAGIGAARSRNNALQEIEAQTLRIESAQFRNSVSEAIVVTDGELISVSATNREDTPVITITAVASTASVAEAAAVAATEQFVNLRVGDANEALERELNPLTGQRDDQLQTIEDMRLELESLRDGDAASTDEISILESRIAAALRRLAEYEKAIQEREFLILSAGGEVQVVNLASAAVESSPSSFMRPLQVAVLALVLALIAAVVVSRVRGRLTLLDDIRAVAGPDIPVLATVPEFRRKFRDGSSALVVGRRNARREAEAFRYLRSAIEVATQGQTPLVVAFTSANPNEGKSVTAGNYALAMARSGRSVAVLDGDLLNSTVSDLFDAEGDNAFAAVMTGQLDPSTKEWFAYPTNEQPVHLLVSPSGSVPVSRYELASERVEAVYGKLETQWNTIVVDCPPVLAVSDSMVLTKAADVAILCVRMGKTSRRQLDNALTQLEQHQVKIAGIVTTFASESSESWYNYGYGYGNSDD